MNLRFVEAFYWVVMLDSVTLAASRLSLTQSAVSSRIAALENELGQPLFDRRTQRLRLTALGERFLPQATRFLELQREVHQVFARPDPAPVTLRIGANESVLHCWLMPFVDALGTAEPQLKLELTIDTTPALHDQVRRGALDICFGTGPIDADGTRSQPLPTLELDFYGAVTRGLRARHGLAELETTTVITFQRSSQPTRALLAQLQALNVSPARLLFTPSISAMLELVRRGFGVATLPRPVAAAGVARRELRPVDLGVPLPPLPVVACWRPDPTSRLIDRVVELATLQARNGAAAARRPHSKTRSAANRKI